METVVSDSSKSHRMLLYPMRQFSPKYGNVNNEYPTEHVICTQKMMKNQDGNLIKIPERQGYGPKAAWCTLFL